MDWTLKPYLQGTLDSVVTKRDSAPTFSTQRVVDAVSRYLVVKDVVSGLLLKSLFHV